MKLHEKKLTKGIARTIAPLISYFIVSFGLAVYFRQLIAFLNYCLGRGAGMGWALSAEVDVAASSVTNDKPVVFDVGGNLGHWSELFRERIPGGVLYIFEPQQACQQSIREKAIPNAELVCSAVGKEKSTMTLYSSSETDGSASLHERGDSFFEEREYSEQTVNVLSLDEFSQEKNLTFIDYVKFDIEGHEFFALEGFQNYLSQGKVGAFSFEFGSGNLNSKTCFRDFWEMLHDHYSIFIITPSGALEEIKEYYEDLEFYRGVSNFVAKLKS